MSDPRFELEQQIFHCWSLVDDIKLLSELAGTEDLDLEELPKVLAGLSNFYQLKFTKLFRSFEATLIKPYAKEDGMVFT